MVSCTRRPDDGLRSLVEYSVWRQHFPRSWSIWVYGMFVPLHAQYLQWKKYFLLYSFRNWTNWTYRDSYASFAQIFLKMTIKITLKGLIQNRWLHLFCNSPSILWMFLVRILSLKTKMVHILFVNIVTFWSGLIMYFRTVIDLSFFISPVPYSIVCSSVLKYVEFVVF